MYVIMNSKTKKYLYGTDFNYTPHRQRTSDDCAMIFSTEDDAKREYKRRMCGKTYIICKISIDVIGTIKL